MVKNVVIHMQNEQPLKADLQSMPTAADAVLLCTNLQYLNGTKPRWTDHVDSWFMIPLVMVRFVEVPKTSLAGRDGIIPLGVTTLHAPEADLVADESLEASDLEDLEPDEDLLRRIREA